MTTPSVGGPGNTSSPNYLDQSQDIPALAQQTQSQIGALSQQLSDLSADPSQASNGTFLQQMASTVNALKQTVDKVLNLRRS